VTGLRELHIRRAGFRIGRAMLAACAAMHRCVEWIGALTEPAQAESRSGPGMVRW